MYWYGWMGLISLGLVFVTVFTSPNPQPTDIPRSLLFWIGVVGCLASIVISVCHGGSWGVFG